MGLHHHKIRCRVTVKHEATSGRFQETFFYRHHVEPRVRLYVPREESFPIPPRYIDVTRATSATLDVLLERRIDDYWIIEGDRDLSDAWTGFPRFTILNAKPSRRVYMVREAADKKANNIQARSLVARNMEKCQTQLNEKKSRSGLSNNRSSTMQES